MQIKKNVMSSINTLIVAISMSGSIFTMAAAAPVTYLDRTAFQATLGSSITDDYSNPGYGSIPHGFHILSDAQMSGVLGEVGYQSTSFNNLNIVSDPSGTDPLYCAGCNGSFKLDFGHTSLGTSSGVFGVGFDVEGIVMYMATIGFGDGSFQDFNLAQLLDDGNPMTTGDTGFFGITSNQLIKSIHFGGPHGSLSPMGYIQIDNLTWGNVANRVPEPTPIALLFFGILALWIARRNKYRSNY